MKMILSRPYTLKFHCFRKVSLSLLIIGCLLCQLSSQSDYVYSEKFLKRIGAQLSNRDSLISNNSAIEKRIKVSLNISWTYLNISGEYLKAENYQQYADSLLQTISNLKLEAESKTVEGRILTKKGFFSSAIQNYQYAYAIKENERDTANMGYLLQLMGKTLREQKKFEASIPILLQSLAFKKIVKKEKPFVVTGMLASSYFQIGDIGQGKSYLDQALSFTENKKKWRSFYDLFIIKGEIALIESKNDTALVYFQKAIEGLHKYGGGKRQVIEAELGIAKALFSLQEYENAEKYALESLIKAQNFSYPYLEIVALEILSNLTLRNNSYEKAYRLKQQYYSKKDSLFKVDEIKQNLDFQRRWQLKEKEQKIDRLRLENKNKINEIKNKRKQNVLLSILLLVVALSLIPIITFFRIKISAQKKMASIKLAIQKEESTKQNLESLIQGQETERQRIAKELHDGLGGMLSAGAITAEKKNTKKEEIRAIFDKSCEELRRISHNMEPVSLEILGLKAALEDLSLFAQQNHFSVFSKVEEIDNLNQAMRKNIYRIIQELYQNAIKHSQASQIILTMHSKDGYIEIHFSDNGIGFDDLIQFSSLGIKNIKSRIEYLGGTLKRTGQSGEGSNYDIKIPINSEV